MHRRSWRCEPQRARCRGKSFASTSIWSRATLSARSFAANRGAVSWGSRMRKGKDEEVGLAPYSGGRARRSAKAVFAKIQEKKRLQAALLAIKTDIAAATQALSAAERRRLNEMLENKCSRAGCERPAMIKGRCNQHYVADWFASQGPCSVAGCRKQAHTGKMCQTHYAQLLKPKTPCSVDDCEALVYSEGNVPKTLSPGARPRRPSHRPSRSFI